METNNHSKHLGSTTSTAANTTVDQTKLNEFMGRAGGRHRRRDERGAGGDRRQARASTRRWRQAGPPTPRPSWPRRTGDHRALRARVAQQPGGQRLRDLRSRPPGGTRCRPSRRWRWPTRTARPSCRARFQVIAAMRGEPRIARRLPHRRRRRLGRAGSHACSWAPNGSSARGTCGNLVDRLDPGAGRRRGQAEGRRAGGRRRVRPRRVDDPDGAGLPDVALPGLRLPTRRRSRRRARGRSDAGVADRVHFEVAGAQDFAGTGYDLVACFDCLHDMGDPAGAARHIRGALAEDGTWLLVEPFADGPGRGQPESGGPRVLRRVDDVLRAVLAGRSRPGAGGTGRGGAVAADRGGRRRLFDPPPRHRDALQPGAGSAAVRVGRIRPRSRT